VHGELRASGGFAWESCVTVNVDDAILAFKDRFLVAGFGIFVGGAKRIDAQKQTNDCGGRY
jgi:hypothetical protein